MGRKPKVYTNSEETVQVPKSQLDSIMQRLDASEAKNAELEAKVAKGGKQGIETAVHRLVNKPQPAEPDMMAAQEKIQVVDEPATKNGTMVKDSCPFCKRFHSGKPTIQDMTNSGKFACRRCGKHWHPWAIKESEISGELYPYSEALERGDKKRVEYQERIKMAQKGAPVALLESEDEGREQN